MANWSRTQSQGWGDLSEGWEATINGTKFTIVVDAKRGGGTLYRHQPGKSPINVKDGPVEQLKRYAETIKFSRPGEKEMMAREVVARKGSKRVELSGPQADGRWVVTVMQEEKQVVPGEANDRFVDSKWYSTEAGARRAASKILASRLGEKEMMATRKPKVREKWETVFYEYFHGVPVSIMDSGKIKNDINAILASGADLKVEMPKLVKKYGRFSRPGAKATFKVEDRFYFGKGRKERFAITRQPGSCLYANNTGTDVSGYHSAIAKAIEKGGKFDSDFSDVFKLTRSPAGSVCLWSLTWA
jgi:hypothetical protein